LKKYLIILAILFATSFINAQTLREFLLRGFGDNSTDLTPPSANYYYWLDADGKYILDADGKYILVRQTSPLPIEVACS